jgi:acetylornithine deacetylase/succinyl-diaminopimelate desuccinylase-like protein
MTSQPAASRENSHVDPAELRATIEALAPIDKGSATPGEREAAEWIAARLEGLGCTVEVEEETVRPDTWRNLIALNAAATLAGIAAARGRRAAPALLATAVLAALVDDIQNGAHAARLLTTPARTTWNVTAECGDREADRTVVVLAHHDAARSGLVFDQAAQRAVWERWPGLIERTNTALPIWYPVLAAPALIAAGALSGRRGLARVGAVIAALSTASFVDIRSRAVVPGANDNLSAVACLTALARRLRDEPVEGVRVLLVSAGSEESFQEGIRAWGRRHFESLPRERTAFVTVDMVGSPELAMIEGEGPVWMEEYDRDLRGRVQAIADRAGIHLRRKLRARTSTDGVIPMRAGFPTVLLGSVEPWKAPSNYHWPTDTPDRIDYSTNADAARLVEAVVRSFGPDGVA